VLRSSGRALAALLLLVAALAIFNYLRHVAIWAPTETVAFESGETRLVGTLIKPSTEGVHPAVIVLHGSGPEKTSGVSYRLTANTLVRSGFAVLLYDKRGVGRSEGDLESALYADFVADAVAAVRYLAGRDDIDADLIGLHGNSEGGWFTPEVAHITQQIAFIFNRVGPPLSRMETGIFEIRNDFLADGIRQSDVDSLLYVVRRAWDYYIAAGRDPDRVLTPEREAINAELTRLRTTVPGADRVLVEALLPYDEETYSDLASDLAYDPGPFLLEIDLPMIYVFGEDDINVPTAKSVKFLEALRADHAKDIDIVVFEGLGHPLATWKGVFTCGNTPAYPGLLGSWARERLADHSP
jgi:pimeloyl-ACP methyl ester carboxylesterase